MKRAALLGLFATLTLAVPLAAQRGQLQPLKPAVHKAFRQVVAVANGATVTVFAGDRRVALGLVVRADGLVVTKASEAGDGELTCIVQGIRRTAQRVGEDEPNDLLLLRVEAQDLPVADWAGAEPVPGAWLATPDGGEEPAGVGILSATPYRHSRQRGYLGVRTHTEPGPPRLQEVQPDTAADAAGLLADDVVLALDEEEIGSYQQFIQGIGRHRPGDLVRLRIRRGEEELEIEVRLRSDRRGPTSGQERLWGPLSEVRAGFGRVLQHDTVLRPDQCGGPLVDLDGKVVGLNIARAGRVETLALPAETVRTAVEKVLGKQ